MYFGLKVFLIFKEEQRRLYEEYVLEDEPKKEGLNESIKELCAVEARYSER